MKIFYFLPVFVILVCSCSEKDNINNQQLASSSQSKIINPEDIRKQMINACKKSDQIRSFTKIGMSEAMLLEKIGKPLSKERSKSGTLMTWKYEIEEGVFYRFNFDQKGVLVGYGWNGVRELQDKWETLLKERKKSEGSL